MEEISYWMWSNQTADKADLALPPSRHLKRFGDWRSLLPTLFHVTTMKSRMSSWTMIFLKLARGGETVMPWWSMSLISLTLMVKSSQAYHVFVSGNDPSWLEIKKISCLLKPRLASGSRSRGRLVQMLDISPKSMPL